MTALALVQTLVRRRAIPASRVKDFRTSLQKLADACQVPLDDLDLVALAPTYEATLKAYFAGLSPAPSVHTQRNTRANLRQFYRALATHALLPVAATPVTPRLQRTRTVAAGSAATPYRRRVTAAGQPRYRLPPERWPASVREGWEHYQASRAFELRPVSLGVHLIYLTGYVSFAVGLDRPPLATWDELFDPARVMRFVAWHAARVGAPRISHTGAEAVWLMVHLAKYTQHPSYTGLFALASKLPPVPRVHDKQAPHHTVSARELEDVGLALLREAHEPVRVRRHAGPERPYRNKHPRLLRAIRHQTALMIRLLWRVPLRNRSIREMALGKNLYRDSDGAWRLRYIGEELKVSQRGGRVNRLDLPWPPELVDHLEEYLRDFRPCFPNADTDPHVFLTKQGRPFSIAVVRTRLADEVYVRLKKWLYPHLLRTLWVDQYLLESNGDVSTAAYMLNDNVQTVLARYHELRGVDHVKKAYDFNRRVLGNRQGTTR